jgi:cysteine-S-conjugate beta-lyase
VGVTPAGVDAGPDVDFDRVIERRETDSNKWHKFGPDVLPLWVADMDFASPEPVIRALQARVHHGVFGYLREQVSELTEVVAARCRARYGWAVEPDWIVVIPGVIPGFNVAARTLLAPGDGLLIQTPAYPPILRVAGNVGLRGVLVDLARRPDGRWEVDLDTFAAGAARARAFLLCNPHNPVGRVFNRRELEAMAEVARRHDLAIVADEIHCDVLFDGRAHVPIASLGRDVAARTITLMAASKTFNLAGLKCAVAIIPDAELRRRFQAARVDMVQPPNVLGYTATLAAYRDGESWLRALLRYLEANRDFLSDYVGRHLPGVAVTLPEGTYLAWLDCREAAVPKDDPFTYFLETARVALNDGATFGAAGAGFVRLNFGCPRATLVDGLDRMRTALAALPATGERRRP